MCLELCKYSFWSLNYKIIQFLPLYVNLYHSLWACFKFWCLLLNTRVKLFEKIMIVKSEIHLIIINCIFFFHHFQGLYAFIVYTILRNQLCRPTKGNYSLNNASYDNSVMLLDNGRYPNNSTMLISAQGPEKGSKVILTKHEHPPAIIMPNKEQDVSNSNVFYFWLWFVWKLKNSTIHKPWNINWQVNKFKLPRNM